MSPRNPLSAPTNARAPRLATLLLASGLALGGLTACSAAAGGPAASATSTATTSAALGSADTAGDVQETGVAGLVAHDAWTKAAAAGEMTATFAMLMNETDADITVVSASAAAAGVGMVELHETVVQSDGSSVMQPQEGGFVVPAHGSLMLEPGGSHFMLMGLAQAIEPGSSIELEFTTADGRTGRIQAPARSYTGAQETYAPDHAGHGGTAVPTP